MHSSSGRYLPSFFLFTCDIHMKAILLLATFFPVKYMFEGGRESIFLFPFDFLFQVFFLFEVNFLDKIRETRRKRMTHLTLDRAKYNHQTKQFFWEQTYFIDVDLLLCYRLTTRRQLVLIKLSLLLVTEVSCKKE